MEFCSSYPTSIVIHAMKKAMNSVESAICIFYKDKSKGRWAKFIDAVCGSDDKVIIHSWGNQYNLDDSMKEATASLKAAMSPEGTKSEHQTGLLNSHVKSAREKLEKSFADWLKGTEENKANLTAKEIAKKARAKDKYQLEAAINEVIEKSS